MPPIVQELEVRGKLDPTVLEAYQNARNQVKGLNSEVTDAKRALAELTKAEGENASSSTAVAAATTRLTVAKADLAKGNEVLTASFQRVSEVVQREGKSYQDLAAEMAKARREAEQLANAQNKVGQPSATDTAAASGGMGSKAFLLRTLGRGAGMEGLGPGGAMLGRAAGVLGGLEGVTAGPIVAAFAAVAGAAALTTTALKNYEDQQSSIQKSLQDESQALAHSSQKWHELRDIVASAGDAHLTTQQKIDALVGKGSIKQLVDGMTSTSMQIAGERSGITPQDFSNKASEAAKRVQADRDRVAELNALDKKASKLGDPYIPQGSTVAYTPSFESSVAGFQGDVKRDDRPRIQSEITAAQARLKMDDQTRAGLQKLADTTKRYADGYRDAADQASRLRTILASFPDKDNISDLTRRKDIIASSLSAYSEEKTGLPDDKEALRGRLLSPISEADRKAITEKLGLIATSDAEQKTRSDFQISQIKDASLQAKNAGLFDETAPNPATRNPDGTVDDPALKVRSQLRESDFTRQALGYANTFGDAAQQKQLSGELRGQELSEGTNGLAASIKPAQEAYKELQASGTATSAQLVAANGRIKDSIDMWVASNGSLIGNLPELKKQVAETYEATKIEAAQAAAKKFGENEIALRGKIGDLLDSAVTKSQQRQAIDQAIALVVSEQHQGLIKQEQATANLIGLKKQAAAIDRQQALDLIKQVEANKDLALTLEHGRASELRTERSRGEVTGSGIDSQIRTDDEDEFRHRFEVVDRNLKNELANTAISEANKVEVYKRAAMERQKIIDDETEHYRDSLRKQDDEFTKSQSKKNGVQGSANSISALPDFGQGFGRLISGLTGGGDNDFIGGQGLTGGGDAMRKSYANTPMAANFQRIAEEQERLAATSQSRGGGSWAAQDAPTQHVTVDVQASPLLIATMRQEINTAERDRLSRQRLQWGNDPPQSAMPG